MECGVEGDSRPRGFIRRSRPARAPRDVPGLEFPIAAVRSLYNISRIFARLPFCSGINKPVRDFLDHAEERLGITRAGPRRLFAEESASNPTMAMGLSSVYVPAKEQISIEAFRMPGSSPGPGMWREGQ